MTGHTMPPISALATALVMCGGTAACDSDPVLPPPGSAILIDFDASQELWPKDGWDFGAATVIDDEFLEIQVSFAGGCRPHDFWLVAVRGFHYLPTAGPTPTVAVPILLAHDAHGDPCEAYLTETSRFDLQPLRDVFEAQSGGRTGRVILRIPMGQGAADTTSIDYFIR
ncbi:MAG: hypothetical protein R3314_04485 [Longimicrobiales bacterium]|nr:hypothetical protein [Longimicrobiales bacterium]